MVHGQVPSAGAARVRITFEFWAGDPLPNSSGKGFVILSRDSDGVRSLILRWLWITPHGNLEALVAMQRVGVIPGGIAAPGEGP